MPGYITARVSKKMSSIGNRVSSGILTAVLTIALTANSTIPAFAQTQATLNNIEMLDKQIADKEIELLRLNSDFRSHYTARDKNKQRRMKFYDFAAGAVANAGDITLMSQFWKYQRNQAKVLITADVCKLAW